SFSPVNGVWLAVRPEPTRPLVSRATSSGVTTSAAVRTPSGAGARGLVPVVSRVCASVMCRRVCRGARFVYPSVTDSPTAHTAPVIAGNKRPDQGIGSGRRPVAHGRISTRSRNLPTGRRGAAGAGPVPGPAPGGGRREPAAASELVDLEVVDHRLGDLPPPLREVALARIADRELVHVARGGPVVEDPQLAGTGVLAVVGGVDDGVLGGLPALVREVGPGVGLRSRRHVQVVAAAVLELGVVVVHLRVRGARDVVAGVLGLLVQVEADPDAAAPVGVSDPVVRVPGLLVRHGTLVVLRDRQAHRQVLLLPRLPAVRERAREG